MEDTAACTKGNRKKNGSHAARGVSKEEQMILATMFFSRGVVNGKKNCSKTS